MIQLLLSVRGQFYSRMIRLIPTYFITWLSKFLLQKRAIQNPDLTSSKQAFFTRIASLIALLLLSAFPLTAKHNYIKPVTTARLRLDDPMNRNIKNTSFYVLNENQLRSCLANASLKQAGNLSANFLEMPLLDGQPKISVNLDSPISILAANDIQAENETSLPVNPSHYNTGIPRISTSDEVSKTAKSGLEAPSMTGVMSSTGIVTTPDKGTVSTGTGGIAINNVAANDLVNGAPATLGSTGNATVNIVEPSPAGISLNTTTGSMSVTQGTVPGSYMVVYQLCDKLTTPTCTTETATITVSAAQPTITISSPANNATTNTTPTVLGTATPGSTVVLTGPANTTLCTTTASTGGNFFCVVTIPAGPISITAAATNGGGSSTPAIINFTAVSSPTGACVATDCNTNVRYGLKIGADGITYTVYMKSEQGLTGAQAQIGTAQVTINLPTGTDITSMTSLQSNTNWTATTPVVQPAENPTKDYRSFGLSQSQPFAIVANAEIPLFSFQRIGTCTGELALWNTGDPFGYPNSLNTSPGNQIAISGYGNTNSWSCNYTCPVACPAPILSLLKLSPGTATQNVPFSYTMTALNSGNGVTSSSISITDMLPIGTTFTTGGGNGWTCSANGQLVTCTSQNAILGGASSSFLLTVNPTLAGTLPNSATLTGGGSTTTVISIPCLTCPVGPTQTVVSQALSDLAVTILMPTPFLAGQANTILVNLTNGLAGLASGPQAISVTLANGLTAPATFSTTNGWTCSTTSQTVVCSNPASLSASQSLPLAISVTPNSSQINNYVIVSAQAAPASNETNTANNVAITAATLVLGSDLALNFGTIPTLTANQNAIIPITISNDGLATAPGALTVNVTLPTGISLTVANLPSGWSLVGSAVGPIVTLTNANSGGLAPSAILTLNLPVSIGANVSGNEALTATVVPVPSESNILNNTNSANTNVLALPRPDLIISAVQPTPALMVGQSSSIAVTITNIGSASATGPISFTIGIPAGMTVNSATLPTGWAVGSVVAASGGSSTYTFVDSGLNIGIAQSTSMTIGVMPDASLSNALLSLNLFVNVVPNEIIVANNSFKLVISTGVQLALAPDLAVVVPIQSLTLAVEQTSSIVFNVINIGTATAGGPLSLTVTMPAGFSTAQSTFTTGIWGCSTTGIHVVCTTVSTLTIAAGTTITIPVVPGPTAGGLINPTFQISVAQATGETNMVNNTGVILYTGSVMAPDLAVSFPTQSFTLSAGQASNILVQVSNVSPLANAIGPLSLTFAMPLSFSVTQSTFVSGSWTCSVAATVIGCTYSGSLSAGASLTLTIPVLPVAGVVNPSFVAIVASLPGELNLINNVAQLAYTGTVLASGIKLALKAILQGPFNDATGLMNDDLRRLSLIPMIQPYSALLGSAANWVLTNSGAETTTSTVLSVTGVNAIVDWVMVELRSSTSPNTIVASKPALIQRDGDVVSSIDGVSSLLFPGLNPASYYVVLRHRNHLGIMSKIPVALSPTTTPVDLTNAANVFVKTFTNTATAPLYTSTNSVTNQPNPAMLWAGDTDGNGIIIFQGSNNDIVPLFSLVLTDLLNINSLTNFISSGYTLSDVSLDGRTIFQGPDNEVNTIFFNVMGHPDNINRFSNFIILQHLP